MSLLGMLNAGRSALFSSQTALAVTNQNIANVNTPGYSRQEAILEIASPVLRLRAGSVGTGVEVSAVRRHYDRFVQAQLFVQLAHEGKSSALEETFGGVEPLFDVSADAGLAASLRGFFGAWQSVAADPTDPARRADLLRYAEQIVSNARRTEEGLLAAVKRADAGVADAAARINVLAQEIARLNGRIVEAEAGKGPASNAERDERDRLLSELSGLADAGWVEDARGAVSVTLGMRTLVSGETANALAAGTSVAGAPVLVLDGIDITARIRGGRIGGLLAARAEIEGNAVAGLRRLMERLAAEVNTLHRQGVGLDGTTGLDFFSVPAGALRDMRVLVTDPRSVAAAVDGAGLPGDNGNAARIAALSDAPLPELGGATVHGYYAGLVARAGSNAREASDSLRFDRNLTAELERRREAVSGVSLDEEAANLIRYQRAFEAGARMIKVTDELLRAVIDL